MSEVTFTFAGKMIPAGLNATHEDVFGKGGFIALTGAAESLTDDNAITAFLNTNVIAERRKVGSLVYISSIEKYYTCTDTNGVWERQKFDGSQYFYGPSAPTASDISLGDKWFNTTVGSEFTYLYTDENQDEFIWVDVDHLGQSEASVKYFYGETPPTGELNLGDKWFNPSVGTEFTYLQIDDNPNNLAWVDIDHVGLDQYVLKTGDTMSGTLTGTNASFNTSVVVSNSGSYENQPFLTVAKVGGTNAGYAGINPGTTGFMDLPRLVLNNFSNNSWGWPKAIDFMTRPTAGAENAVIGWRIGDSYNTSGKSFLTFWGAPSRTGSSQQAVGISAGLSGQGLEKLGYFQVGVGRDDNGLYTEKSFRISSDPEFRTDEFITKAYGDENYLLGDLSGYETKTSDKNLITNGNFLVWQRGRQFRYLSDTRLRNQTKKQIGFNYFNVEHNANFYTPKTHISGRFKSGNYNYGSMFSAAADRWVFGWQNIEDGNPSAPVTGSGFYVYRGFINPEDSQIVKNSKYFCRVSTSPPPSYSENRTETIYSDPTTIGSIQNLVNPTSPNGLTYGAIVNHLLSNDRPSELSGQTADLRRVTDTQYVSSYFDPYNTCIPITGDTDVPGTRAKLRDDYWAGFSQTISYEDFRSMDFGTENAKDLTLRFYARGNVPGEYYVTFTNAGVRTLGASQYPDRSRLYTKAFTIDEPNQWKLCQITCEGDKVNESSDGNLQGCWNYPNKRGNWPGLQVNWCVGSASTFQAPNSSWKEVSGNSRHTLAIKDDGSIWSWGSNQNFALGIGNDTSPKTSPQNITGGIWTSVSAGLEHSVAIKQDGTLWSWGQNDRGQLGYSTPLTTSLPIQVENDNNWASVSCGLYHNAAIKQDGTLWTWGNNNVGQLGLGTIGGQSSTPSEVDGDGVTWASVSCGNDFTIAIKNDGTLWAWGSNGRGQLGIGSGSGNQNIGYPTIIDPGSEDWSSISCGGLHALGIKNNGDLYAWGDNIFNQLGMVAPPYLTTPFLVDDSSWQHVSAAEFHSLGIKSDGSLWGWGRNTNGELGFDDPQANTPTRIGQDSWKYITSGGNSSFGFKSGTDSPLWSWGRNDKGQLGQGDFILRYRPTLLTLLVIGGVPFDSWRYAEEGNVWGASGQANLLSATGNYLDIAEVSLVDANYTKEIYFPRSDSEIITECRKYFFGSKVYQSETTPYPIDDYGTFNNIGLGYFISTNEMTVSDMPDIVRWPHNGSPYSELFSSPVVTYGERTISVPLAETCFSRAFNCIGSAASTNVFPADNTTLPSNHRYDYNINNGTVNYVSPAGTYTTNSVVQAIATHNGSPFGDNAKREALGWDGATSDMINYFMYPYGYRGFCSPRILNATDNTASRFTQLNRLAVQYSNTDPTTEDVILAGRVWLDTEFAYGD